MVYVLIALGLAVVIGRADAFAHTAFDALPGVDVVHSFTLIDAINRAGRCANAILDVHTGTGDGCAP